MAHIEDRIEELEKKMNFLFDKFDVIDCHECWGTGEIWYKEIKYNAKCKDCEGFGFVVGAQE